MTGPLPQTLRDIVEDAITNHPRSQQATIGPSELGTPCDRCLIHRLAGHKPVDHVVPWLPTIGTAVHSWLEGVFRERIFLFDEERWWPEMSVTVGHINGQPITGHADLFDADTGTVIDFKVVGKTTLDKARRAGAPIGYQRQAHLYGKGFEDEGRTVNTVLIWFLPRNAVSLQHGHVWEEPYDRAIAETTLARANALTAGINALGVDAVLGMTPPHLGTEFACGKWPQDPSAPAEVSTTNTLLNLTP